MPRSLNSRRDLRKRSKNDCLVQHEGYHSPHNGALWGQGQTAETKSRYRRHFFYHPMANQSGDSLSVRPSCDYAHSMNEKTIHPKYQLCIKDPMVHQEISVNAAGPAQTSKADRIRYALATLGGLAGLRSIMGKLKQMGHSAIRTRIKDSLKDMPDVRYLGAGYYCFDDCHQPRLQVWLGRWLRRSGPQSEQECVEMIRVHYPNGCPSSIRRWLSQQPNIRKYRNKLHWVDQSSQARPQS